MEPDADETTKQPKAPMSLKYLFLYCVLFGVVFALMPSNEPMDAGQRVQVYLFVMLVFGGTGVGLAALKRARQERWAKRYRVACPYCETPSEVWHDSLNIKCRRCKQRSPIKDGVAIKVSYKVEAVKTE